MSNQLTQPHGKRPQRRQNKLKGSSHYHPGAEPALNGDSPNGNGADYGEVPAPVFRPIEGLTWKEMISELDFLSGEIDRLCEPAKRQPRSAETWKAYVIRSAYVGRHKNLRAVIGAEMECSLGVAFIAAAHQCLPIEVFNSIQRRAIEIQKKLLEQTDHATPQ